MFSEQCNGTLSYLSRRLSFLPAENSLVNDLPSNSSNNDFPGLVLQPDTSSMLLWMNTSNIVQNIVMLDWALFFLMVIPRKLSPKWRAISLCKFRSALVVLKKIEFIGKQVMEAAIGCFLLATFLPILILGFVIFGITVQVVKQILKTKYGQTASKAEALDAIWGSETPQNRPFITAFITLTGEPSINKIRALIQARVLDRKDSSGNLLYRKFKQLLRVEYGYFIWKDASNFDIRKHIKVWNHDGFNVRKYERNEKTNVENNFETAEDVVHRYVNMHGSKPMRGDRPKWEIILLQSDAYPHGKYSVVVRLHHSIGDGVSLMRLITDTLVDCSERAVLSATLRPRPHVGVAGALFSACMMPLELAKAVLNSDENPLHGRPLSGNKMYFMSRPVNLATVMNIRRATGCTVNDVLMSCVSAAFSRTFTHRCRQTVTLVVPICCHDLNEPTLLINKLLMATLKLPVLSSPGVSPLHRLHLVKSACDTMKNTPGLLAGHHTMVLLSGLLPASLARKVLSLPGITMGASNVPGPQQAVRLWGDSVDSLGFWVPDRAPTAAGLGLLSYNNTVRLFLNADTGLEATKSEMDQFTKEFETEVTLLHEAVLTMQQEKNTH
ncbi:O-acyltransferase WSD1 C-terminal [Trinorchestia longiramus]|nr:O-acyltransferase WSD1 C-terminal [Trinorchestia longiramus]